MNNKKRIVDFSFSLFFYLIFSMQSHFKVSLFVVCATRTPHSRSHFDAYETCMEHLMEHVSQLKLVATTRFLKNG